jgi:CBS domain containing-hemolysin-like protein
MPEPHTLSAGTVVTQLLIVFALVLLNGFFVASEYALVSVRKTRIDQLAAEGNASAALVQRALRDINRYIAATQIGITLAALVLGSMGEQTLAPLFGRALAFLPAGVVAATRGAIAVFLAYFIMTVFTVIIGELLPKSFTLQKAETVSMLVVRPMLLFVKLTLPFVWMLNGIGTFLLRRMGIQTSDEHAPVHSPEELDLLFTQSHEGGQLTQIERDLLHRVVKFSDLTAREVMVPRVEMQAIPLEMERAAFFAFLHGQKTHGPGAGAPLRSTPHTRTPVYRGSMDEIVGVAHLKDLVRYGEELRGSDHTTINLAKVTREVLRVPETITIDKLLREFQRRRQQMAIVIDEYGGTSGLITMGDLLAQVFGDVPDEFDRTEPEIVEQAPNVISVAGRVLIDEINERFDTGFRCDDADTLAGLVLNKLGRPAVVGDEIEINQVRLRVLALDRLRITRLQVQLPQGVAEKSREKN